MMSGEYEPKGIINWFARNPVAANLLMALILFSGILVAQSIRKQTTPEFELDIITVTVPYPGAAPQEVEQGIVTRIEEAIVNLPGIAKTEGRAYEGSVVVSIELEPGANLDFVQNQVKTRVDAIPTLPELRRSR